MSSMSSDNDIVIVEALRTPLSRATRGNFKDLTNDMLVYYAIKGILEKTKIEAKLIDEICFGHGLSPLNGTQPLRIGALRAGVPLTVPISTYNRQCASGLDAVNTLANKIRVGEIQIGLAGGFESMTSYSIDQGKSTCLDTDQEKVKECFLSMGETAELLAEKYNIIREESDKYALESQRRAFEATEKGLYSNEIIPVVVNNQVIDKDDGIRLTSLDKLGNLRSVFKENGVCTAGNSSQLSDGASAILLMKREKASELNLKIMGSLVDYVCVGTNPSLMGQGPVPAVRKLLSKNNLTIENIDYFEINEAFACQAVHCIKELGIPSHKVNLQGGSIALGHPIGCTGARLVATLLNVMRNNNLRGYGIISLCVGTGQGVAALIKIE
ncbi:3-ketoacyl-coA thiolase, peroxisomal [Vairimorpha necatrix]|uniref:acetyl-CoA C-acyltransferase n=1 Tax=Vairimorpha necatrix TaxID=6039 RepID=A0AAX4J9Q0_9MICR